MSMQINKAENVLAKANELLDIGGRISALELLYEFMLNARSKYWKKTYEDIVIKMIDICIDLKDSQSLKKSLSAYRYSSSRNPNSFGFVIEYLISAVENKVKSAGSLVEIKNLANEVKDLDNNDSSSSLISSEKSKERAERIILLPWIRLLWDSYRFVLDLLAKDAKKTEQFYHFIALRACKFTHDYIRATEFRYLCDSLSDHLNRLVGDMNIQDGSISQTTIDLNLKLRFEQLDVALALHTWNEAFKIIDDIRNLMVISKRVTPLAKANYFSKLSNLFLESNNLLFHSYALKQYFILYRDNNKSFKSKAEELSNELTLAVLSIPLEKNKTNSIGNEGTTEKIEIQKMAKLLGFDINLSRERILLDITQNLNILEYVSNDVRDMFNALEYDFDPLNMASRSLPVIASISNNEKLKHYREPLENLLINRSLIQLSKVYTTFKLDQFHELLNGVKSSKLEVEKCVIRSLKNQQLGSVNVTIDHKNSCLKFSNNILDDSSSILSEIAFELSAIIPQIEENKKIQEVSIEQKIINEERQAILKRKQLIEIQKRDMNILKQLVAEEAKERTAELKRKKEKEEKEKHDEALRIREEKEREKKEKAQKDLILRQRLLDNGYKVSNELTPAQQIEKINERKKKENEVAIKAEKKVSHAVMQYDILIRAQRELERQKLKETIKKNAIDHEVQYKENVKNLLASSESEHKLGLERKSQLELLQNFKGEFENLILPVWTNDLESLIEKSKNELEEQKRQNKLERAKHRKFEAIQKKRKEELSRKLDEEDNKRIRLQEEKEVQEALEAAAQKVILEKQKEDNKIVVINNSKPIEDQKSSSSTTTTSEPEKKSGAYVPPSKRNQSASSSSDVRVSTSTSNPSSSTSAGAWKPKFMERSTSNSSSNNSNVPAAFSSMRKPKTNDQEQEKQPSEQKKSAWNR